MPHRANHHARPRRHRRAILASAVFLLLAPAIPAGGHSADTSPSLTGPAPAAETAVTVPAAPAGHQAVSSSTTVPCGPTDVWLVNTRSLRRGCALAQDDFKPQVRRYDGTAWATASLADLVASTTDDMLTTMVIHGNNTTANQAVSKGFQVHRKLRASAPAGVPWRLVIWSWPSDRLPGPIYDAQVKAQRTESEGFYLAVFLDQLRGGSRLNMVGFSFGARVITGGLHLLGGGKLGGHELPAQREESRPSMSVVLMAAAMDDHWLAPQARHGRALSQVERMFVMYNPDDRVLRFYPGLPGGGGSQAMGVSGVRCLARLGDKRHKVAQANVSNKVGNKHGWPHYMASGGITRLLRREVFRAGTKTLLEPSEPL